MATIYATAGGQGIDVNQVFFTDLVGSPEYPAPPFAPGELAWGSDGSEWVYCQASIAITPGQVVLINPQYSVGIGNVASQAWSVSLIGGSTAANAPVGQLVGVVGGSAGTQTVSAPSGTQSAANFWVQRAGNCPNIAGFSGISGTTLTQLHSAPTLAGFLTAAAGGIGTSYQVAGIAFTNATASAAGPNTGVLNYPYVSATN